VFLVGVGAFDVFSIRLAAGGLEVFQGEGYCLNASALDGWFHCGPECFDAFSSLKDLRFET
jgi:hypothetical protein